MKKNGGVIKSWNNFKVGWFLAVRQIKGSSRWTTGLIIFIMVLTYLNMVVISGILVGLIEGGSRANREQYTGDIIITVLPGESEIKHTAEIEETLKAMPVVLDLSVRYAEGAEIEANYRTRRDFSEVRDTAGAQIVGLDFAEEEKLSRLSHYVDEGENLKQDETGYILIGKNLLHRYSEAFGDIFASLDGVYPGDRVRVSLQGKTKEFVVKGIINSKVDQTSLRAFITREDFFRLVDRPSLNASEIAIRLAPRAVPERVKADLLSLGFGDYGRVKTALEAIPEFLNQIKIAFSLLGNVIGLIGIAVASITIFIVIFINAVTRRKYIGIMKGIGISERSIEISYVLQSLFYAVLGGVLGIFLVYALLVPAFLAHPLNFPFSDGILVAPVPSAAIKFTLLLIVTVLAGFIPARMIVKKNTLDSILGR